MTGHKGSCFVCTWSHDRNTVFQPFHEKPPAYTNNHTHPLRSLMGLFTPVVHH